MSNANFPIVILGAGVAGLSTAWKLLRQNPELQVTLLEREAQPGGLAKSIDWNGYVLDLGPHRFYTEIPEVQEFIRTFCQERMMRVTRSSRMFLNGYYIPYPVSPLPTFRALGWRETFEFTCSALGVLFHQNKNPRSYEDYVKGYYGESLYRRIFKPFAEKVWGVPASEISEETARVRLRGSSIWHALWDGLFAKEETYVAQFLYPPGGIGEIPRQFAEEIQSMGGRILLDHEVTRVQVNEGKVQSVEASGPKGIQRFDCRWLVNTLPLSTLVKLFDTNVDEQVRQAADGLCYRALTLLYLQYEEELNIQDTWLYYPEDHVPFSRIYVPDNFAPHKKQPGKTCLCVEFPCNVNSTIWNAEAHDLAKQADAILQSSGLTHSHSRDSLVVRIQEGYPLYTIGYDLRLSTVLPYLRSLKNCLSTGRQGLFRHNNLDQSIQMGLAAAESILRHPDGNDWYDHSSRFNEYRIID